MLWVCASALETVKFVPLIVAPPAEPVLAAEEAPLVRTGIWTGQLVAAGPRIAGVCLELDDVPLIHGNRTRQPHANRTARHHQADVKPLVRRRQLQVSEPEFAKGRRAA